MTLHRRSLLRSSVAAAGLLATQRSQDDTKSVGVSESDRPFGPQSQTRFAANIEMWWRGIPFLERIDAAAALGFPAVEFWPFHNKDIDAVAERAKAAGVVIAQFTAWGFRPGMNEVKNHAAFEAKIKEACGVAKRMDCKLATVVGGNDVAGVSQAQMHENIIVALKRVAPIAEDNDITLILEPMNIRVDHKGHCLYGSPDAVRICREVDSTHVKINWDLYHMQISEGDLCGRLAEGFDQVGYLQLADHPGRREPGTGEIHYARVLRQAHDLGYRGFVGVECYPSEAPLKSARRMAAAVRW